MFYLLKHISLPYRVILKQSCNKIISTFIMSLYVSYVCLHILASSRIPRSILRRWTPHFWGGCVTLSKCINKNFRCKVIRAHKTCDLFPKLSNTKVFMSPLRMQQRVGLQPTLEPHQMTIEVDLGSSLNILSRGGQYKLPGTQPQAWDFLGSA
jgi:hypothetical protein